MLIVVARIQSSNLTENNITAVEKTELCFLVYRDSSPQNKKIIHRAVSCRNVFLSHGRGANASDNMGPIH